MLKNRNIKKAIGYLHVVYRCYQMYHAKGFIFFLIGRLSVLEPDPKQFTDMNIYIYMNNMYIIK